MKRAARLFYLHESLSKGDDILDAHEWAQHFGVNVRTVLRDMSFLKQKMNVSIIFDPQLGGYRYEHTKRPFMSETKLNKWNRLLTLIHRITAEPGKTARELADVAGCDERTIFRDVRALEDMGLPIYNDRGYRFASDAFLPNLHLTPTELFSIFVAVRLLESQKDSELAGEARRGLEKMLRATSEEKRLDVGELREAVQVKEVDSETGAGYLTAMQDALCSGRQLEIRYQGMKDEEPRVRRLDPMGLFCFRQVWYLHAFDHDREALRNFRLTRVHGAALTDQPVKQEPKLELDNASYHKWDVEGDEKADVRIQVTPSLARWLEENPAHPTQTIQGDEVCFKVSDPRAMALWVTSLYGLKVLEPKSLRDEILRIGEHLVNTYGE